MRGRREFTQGLAPNPALKSRCSHNMMPSNVKLDIVDKYYRIGNKIENSNEFNEFKPLFQSTDHFIDMTVFFGRRDHSTKYMVLEIKI